MPVQVIAARDVYTDPAWAAKYSRVPFVDRGLSFSGVHCAGLIRLAFKQEHGIGLPEAGMVGAAEVIRAQRVLRRTKALPPWSCVAAIEARETGADFVKRVAAGRVLRAFDVAVMLRSDPVRGRLVEGHVGLMIDWRTMIHTEAHCGTIKQRITGAAVSWRATGFYRHEALA